MKTIKSEGQFLAEMYDVKAEPRGLAKKKEIDKSLINQEGKNLNLFFCEFYSKEKIWIWAN